MKESKRWTSVQLEFIVKLNTCPPFGENEEKLLMSYLSHDERRQMILETAVKIAFSEGLSAMTVRRIAQEAQSAIGQIHRHFSSASELKAEAFLLSVTQALALLNDDGKTEKVSCYQLLNWCLFTAHFDDTRHYSQLWKEAEVMSYHDEIMMNAFRAATKMWHNSLVTILEKGISSGEFSCNRSVDSAAWDFISFSHGLDGIYNLKVDGFGESEYIRHAESFLENYIKIK
ncbi:TetR family transcriptional regulator [Enterobacter sp.]|uniref:TetR family transcriptional regulator n=1 Tax=Enterobacter sp. TaxID=42895 RepID=UPI00296FC15B|nr:TetR family transcriptional regulator [Enterobacter sp.]